MSTSDKLTVISFDGTYVSSRICFEKKNERVIGPHKCVQTVMARGTYFFKIVLFGITVDIYVCKMI